MNNVDVGGLSVTFGNSTNKDKYAIYFILKGKKKMGWVYPKNKEKAKKMYEKIMANKPRFIDVRLTKANSIYTEHVATYCPKKFVDNNNIIRVKQNKEWRKK